MIHNGIEVIDEKTALPPSKEQSGLIPRDFAAIPYGSQPFAAPFSRPTIPRNQWKERIKELERTKSRNTDVAAAMGVKPKHQGYTNYCWIFSVVMALEVVRARQGYTKYVPLSATSCAGPITRYANSAGRPAGVGGWCSMGIKYLAANGAATVKTWPEGKIDPALNTAAAKAERAKYQLDEWDDLKPRSFDQLMTCLLTGIPVCAGHSWMRHAVTHMDPLVLKDGRFGTMAWNSGLYRDKNGLTIFTESRATPDDAQAPRVGTQS